MTLPQQTERERRTLWILGGDGLPTQAEGLICSTSPGYWYFPSIGSSMCVGFSVWETEDAAREAAIKSAKADMANAYRRLDALDVWAARSDG